MCCAKQHKLNNNKTIYSTVIGYWKSKCSSKLVAQKVPILANRQYYRTQNNYHSYP